MAAGCPLIPDNGALSGWSDTVHLVLAANARAAAAQPSSSSGDAKDECKSGGVPVTSTLRRSGSHEKVGNVLRICQRPLVFLLPDVEPLDAAVGLEAPPFTDQT